MDLDSDDPANWVNAHGTALYRYGLLCLRDPHRAEDAVQETLLAALQARSRFAGHSSRRTWLIGILRHKISDQFRREARELPLEVGDCADPGDDDGVTAASFGPDGHWTAQLGDWGNPEAALESAQFWTVLQRCLDLLPKRLARLFTLREVFGEESEKICQDLAITPTNLWTMLYRARLGLRQCLDRNWVGQARGVR